MPKPFAGKVALDIRDSEQDWTPFLAPKAQEGAPNVLFVCWDDLGYAASEVYGGPIETPALRRIAERGVRFANFHTTALCSPTRSSLLTGRNATSNGMATIAEFASGFPGISTRIPFENGFISEVLAERGYNTYCVGKWHLTPGEECNQAAFKGRWPLGRGFERFYGFLGGESNSWYPDLVNDNHPVDAPATPEEGYHLSEDLADQAIKLIRDAKVVDPDKPFFLYYAPQAAHAPHHAPAEWIEHYRGRFDEGYEAIREGILRRQIELGLLPEDTELSPINPHGEPDRVGPDGQPWPVLDSVRPWADLSEDEQRLFARMAEVFAGYVSHADEQIGRVLDHLEEIGELDDTLIVVISDNGSSGEGGPNGSANEWRFFNGVPDTTDLIVPRIDELGSPTTYNHYCTGWAWAFDTPFPYWKRWSGYEGGVADLCVVSWPARIEAQAEPRQQYVHAVDVVPTVYELLDVEPPEVIKGFPQSPIEGESFATALVDAEAPGRATQFYAMLGQRALYHEGWLACSLHPPLSGWGHFEHDEWELYHLDQDRSQNRNLAAEEPERLARLKELWFYYAGIYDGLPIDDRSALEQVLAERPKPGPDRDRYEYFPNSSDVPESATGSIVGRSFTLAAGVRVDEADAEGVLFAHGGVAGGHSLYVQERRVHYAFNWLGTDLRTISADRDLEPGPHVITADFHVEGQSEDPAQPGHAGTLVLYVDDVEVGRGDVVTQPGAFCLVGDGVCVGRDSASPVTPAYVAPFAFRGGVIDRVVLDLSGEPYVDHEAQVRGWFILD